MSADEVANKINKYFDGQAKAYKISQYKVEVDVSKELTKDDWNKCIEHFQMKDNTKSIPNSYKFEDITVVFFYGALQKFNQKGKPNWNIGSVPQNLR